MMASGEPLQSQIVELQNEQIVMNENTQANEVEQTEQNVPAQGPHTIEQVVGHPAVSLTPSVQQGTYGTMPDPPGLPMGTSNEVPAGIQHALLDGIGDDEDEASGFVSGREWKARVPSIAGGQEQLKTTFVKVGNLNTAMEYPTENPYCSMDVEDFRRCEDGVDIALKPQSFKDNRVIVGITKGVHRTARQCKLDYVRYDGVMTVTPSLWRSQRVMLTPEPGYAAVFLSALDSDNLAARRALNQVFNDASNVLADIGAAAAHMREMFERPVEVTRYTMRLAMMYVEARLLSPDPHGMVTFESPDQPEWVRATSWAAFRREVITDQKRFSEVNYIPWMSMTACQLPMEGKLVEVLAAASLPNLSLKIGDNYKPLMCWPSINNTRMITNTGFLASTEQGFWEFYPSQIYAAARAWCGRYGDVDLLDQLLQFCFIMYWGDARRGGINVASGMTDLAICLPVANMRGYLAAPYLAVRDVTRDVLREIGTEDHKRQVSESVSTATLLSLGHSWVSWKYTDYLMLAEKLNETEIERRLGMVRIQSDRVPRWGMVQQFLNGLGYRGKVGNWLSRVGSMVTVQKYTRGYIEQKRVMTGDVIPFLPRLPDGCGAQGWISPMPVPGDLGLANQAVVFSDLPKADMRRMVASLDELRNIDFWFTRQSRTSLTLTQTAAPRPKRAMSGVAPDMPFMAVTVRGGDRIRWGFTIPQASIGPAIYGTHDRYNLDWYVMRGSAEQRGVFIETPLETEPVNIGKQEQSEDDKLMRALEDQRRTQEHKHKMDLARLENQLKMEMEKQQAALKAAAEKAAAEEATPSPPPPPKAAGPPPPPPAPSMKTLGISQMEKPSGGDFSEELKDFATMGRREVDQMEEMLQSQRDAVMEEARQRDVERRKAGWFGKVEGKKKDTSGTCRGPWTE
ncbi:capsid protein [Callinectes sapidus toti-like virus 2]|nr:capsid protein [Callinectes sapidus toti-like virus 2]